MGQNSLRFLRKLITSVAYAVVNATTLHAITNRWKL